MHGRCSCVLGLPRTTLCREANILLRLHLNGPEVYVNNNEAQSDLSGCSRALKSTRKPSCAWCDNWESVMQFKVAV
jgi:hypothetical protein